MLKKSVTKLKANKRTAIVGGIFIGVIVIAIAAVVVFNVRDKSQSSTDGNAVFTIDGKNYSQQEVEKITRYPVNVLGMSKDDAAKAAYEDLAKIRTAEKNQVMPPNDFVDRYKKEAISTFKTDDSNTEDVVAWVNIVATSDAIDASISRDSPAGISGYSYVFYFGQHQQYDISNKVAGAGDANLIKADRAAAEKKANEYHDALQRKEVSSKELLDRASKDQPRSMFDYSAQFDSSSAEPWDSKVYFRPIVDYIKTQAKLGTSDIMTGQAVSTVTTNKEDMYFYFVDMNTVVANALSPQDFAKKVEGLPRNYKGFAQ